MKITFLSIKPYTIIGNNKNKHSTKICLSPYMGVFKGEKLYQAKLEDGCIIMIPEKCHEKYMDKKEFNI